ncbi:type I polyketide synthase, partial [Amycolatopsis sp. A133]|uniref:type I polyketide synthase n=1 Tax=Amycolatopsis sp. A133 TaxID=3064472 RepID=UPI002800273B
PPAATPAEPLRFLPWLLSARTPAALAAQASGLLDHLDADGPDPLDVAHSLATTRPHHAHRAVVLGAGITELTAGLRALAAGEPATAVHTGHAGGGALAVLFPGQASPYPRMAEELYRTVPAFAAAFDEVCAELDRHRERPLAEVVFGGDATELARTDHNQAGVFAVEVALFRLLAESGVRPDFVAGHSVGEIAVAHVAGVLSLADAATLVTARGRLMRELPPGGAMAALAASEAQVRALIAGRDHEIAIAAVNGPASVVISGDEAAVLAVTEEFTAAGGRASRLAVSHAFHSHHMDAVLDPFLDAVRALRFAKPRIPIISSVTGAPDGLDTPEYWIRHARETVRFADVLDQLGRAGVRTCLEAGPGTALTTAGQQALTGVTFLSSLRRGHAEPRTVLAALAGLHTAGVPVDWALWHAGGRRADLPGYAFQRERYWLRGDTQVPADDPGRVTESWVPLSGADEAAPTGTWLLLAPPHRDLVITGITGALTERGVAVVTVRHDGTEREGWARRLAEAAPPPVDGIISVAGSVPGILAVLQALEDAGPAGPLWTITRGAVTAGAAVSDPRQAGIWGLGRVAALEVPHRWGGLIDLPEVLDDATWRALGAALAAPPGEDQLAIRDGVVRTRRLAHAPAEPANTGRWRPHGTVLVTGGLGGLGAHVARWLARGGAEHLLLLGRRGRRTPGADDLRAQLEAAGAQVTIAACDITDTAALREVLAGRSLTGVFHAAGVLDDGIIESLTPQRLQTVFATKAGAAVALHELTRDHPVERFVLFSSFAGVLGSPGQGNYAAANAVLDALAQHRAGLGLPATAVAWGPWEATGMANTFDTGRHDGVTPLSPERALAALDRSLAEPAGPAVAVGVVDWDRFAAAYTVTRPSALFAGLTTTHGSGPVPGRRLAELPAAERDELLLELVVKHVAAVSGHAAGTIAVHRPFRELGLDSLASTQLRNRVNAETGLRLATTVVYEHPTPAALAKHLRAGLDAPERHIAVALAQLRQLETTLAELPAEAGPEIRGRLDALVRSWHEPGRAGELNLDVGSDDEMFALIDDVLDR